MKTLSWATRAVERVLIKIWRRLRRRCLVCNEKLARNLFGQHYCPACVLGPDWRERFGVWLLDI